MKKKGFTLIELLVVISIISLLTSVVLASLNESRAKARDTRRIEDLRQINTAIQLYIQNNNEAPRPLTGDSTFNSADTVRWSELENALSPYISKLPVDPLNGQQITNYPSVYDNYSEDYKPRHYSYRYRQRSESDYCGTYPEKCSPEDYILDISAFETREKDLAPLSYFWGGSYPLYDTSNNSPQI